MSRLATHSKIELDGLTVAYRELGEGPPVLLLHGWPTSSHMWRNVMPAIAERHRAIAPDLPGFGASTKAPDLGYDFADYDRVLDGFLDTLGVESAALVLHDLGGPLGLHWALDRPERVTHLVLLNTVLYPPFDEQGERFMEMCTTPGLRERLTSRKGLAFVMKLGMASEPSEELIDAIVEPFGSDDERLSLAAAGAGQSYAEFEELGRRVRELRMPVDVLYGEEDRVLTDIGEKMGQLQVDLPHATVATLPGVGHFLTEDAPEEVGARIAAMLAA